MIEQIKEYLQINKATDLEVNYRVQKIWEDLENKNLSADEIYHIQQSFGYDIACGILYKTMRENSQFVDFSQYVEKPQEVYDKKNKDILVAVFTHNPWESKKNNEAYQWQLKNMAADMGFDCAYPEMQYRRSVFPNAYYYQELMKRWQGRKIILITHGLASLEMRLVLEKSVQLNVNIIGWLNVSGLLYGTSLAPFNKDVFNHLKKYFNAEYPVLPEVARSNTFCYGPLKISPKIQMVNVVGLRPQRYYYFFEKVSDQQLNYWGPHDGYVTISDYLQKPGVTWPFWGQGHYISVPIYKKRLQTALKWMVEKSNREINLSSQVND